MTIKDTATQEFLSRSMEELRHLYPEFDGIMERANEGEITADGAFAEMAKLMAATPDRAEKFLAQSLVKYNERFEDIDPINLDTVKPEELIIKPKKGLPRLHPLYEAALVERLQFDGDIPEARSGPLPEGAEPAISVETDGRNPVLIGFLLEIASRETKGELEESQKREWDRLSDIAAPLQNDTNPALAHRVGGELAKSFINADNDPDRYRRGQVPAPFKLHGEKPDGSTLANLEPEDRQRFTWKFVSTTQGRRSAMPIIERDVVAALEKAGIRVELGEGDATKVVAEKFWTMNLDNDAGSIQPGFPFIDVAAKSIAAGLLTQIKEQGSSLVLLATNTVNQASERRIGWCATAYRHEGS